MRARRVVLANGGLKEAELGRLADDQSELAAAQIDGGAFLHAERRHRERLHRRAHAGHRGQRAFDADVVGARHSAANPYASAGASQSIISRAARHRVHQILAEQGRSRAQAFLRQPAVEHIENSLPHQLANAALRR